MILWANSRTRIKKGVVTHIFRNILGQGKILVNIGQEVKPSDILGRASVSGGFRKIDLSQQLKVEPGQVKSHLNRELGQIIYKGELLAFSKGGFLGGKKIITAPTDGILESLDSATGELTIRFLPRNMDLPAAVFGVVDAISSSPRRVSIRCEVTQVLGIFGSGKAREGILKILSRADLINTNQILPQYAEQIVVAGSLIYKDAILSSISKGVNGIITGGINAKDYRAMAGGRVIFPRKMGSDIGLGVLVTEGFGSLPIGRDIFEVLKSFSGRFAILDGNSGVLNLPSFENSSMDRVRKVSLPQESNLVIGRDEIVARELKKSQAVRVIASPFMGEAGSLESIDQMPTALPTGIKTYLVNIRTQTRMIRVPYSNIEIINQ